MPRGVWRFFLAIAAPLRHCCRLDGDAQLLGSGSAPLAKRRRSKRMISRDSLRQCCCRRTSVMSLFCSCSLEPYPSSAAFRDSGYGEASPLSKLEEVPAPASASRAPLRACRPPHVPRVPRVNVASPRPKHKQPSERSGAALCRGFQASSGSKRNFLGASHLISIAYRPPWAAISKPPQGKKAKKAPIHHGLHPLLHFRQPDRRGRRPARVGQPLRCVRRPGR